MKLVFFILTLFTSVFKSQISINYSIKNLEGTNKHILNINIVNHTKIKYLIPLDTTGFRVYYPDEPCSNFYYELSADKGLGLTLLFKDNQDYVIGESKNHHLRDIDVDTIVTSKLDKKNKEKLNKWKKKWGFKSEFSAKKNMYLYQSLISLKPNESISFRKELDFSEFNNTDSFYNMYSLENGKVYGFSLSYCIDKNIYLNLTSKQKKILKNHSLFAGAITSKEIEFKQ